MVTETVEQTIQTSVGTIPSPSNWMSRNTEMMDTFVNTDEDGSVAFLEKATDGRVTVDDIQDALSEYKRLYKAGI